jgi:hypothetical protein
MQAISAKHISACEDEHFLLASDKKMFSVWKELDRYCSHLSTHLPHYDFTLKYYLMWTYDQSALTKFFINGNCNETVKQTNKF